MATTIRINVYRVDGEWYGARWVDGDYDGCDPLDVAADATAAEAIAHAETMPLVVGGERTVVEVAS